MQKAYTRKQTTTQTRAPEQKPHTMGTLSNSARCTQHEHSAQETRDSVTRVHRRAQRTGKQGVRERGQYLQLAFGIGATAVDSGNDLHIRRSPGRRRLTRKRVRVP